MRPSQPLILHHFLARQFRVPYHHHWPWSLNAYREFIMKKLLILLFVLTGIIFTLLIGVNSIYIGLFASEQELSQYPWGTELGWTYLNKTNYMMSGIVKSCLSWLPLIMDFLIKHLTIRLRGSRAKFLVN